jgi:hypothetical protein
MWLFDPLWDAWWKTCSEFNTVIHYSSFKEGAPHEKEEPDRDGKEDRLTRKKGDG